MRFIKEAIYGFKDFDEFREKSKKLGMKTLGDVKRMKQEPEHFTKGGKERSDIQTMRSYSKVANPKGLDLDEALGLKEDTHLVNAYYIVDSDGEIKGDNLTREEAKELTRQLKETAEDYIYVTRNATYEINGHRKDSYEDIVDVAKDYEVGKNYGNWAVYKDLFNIFKSVDEKLIQSDSEKAFKKNVETEIKAGKDPKQAVAIAHSVKERNESVDTEYASFKDRAKVKAFVSGDRVKYVGNKYPEHKDRKWTIGDNGYWQGYNHLYKIVADDERFDKYGYSDKVHYVNANELDADFEG